MRRKIWIGLFIFLLSGIVTLSRAADEQDFFGKIEEKSQAIKSRYCPDRRTSVWNVSFMTVGDQLSVSGETDSREAWQDFRQWLQNNSAEMDLDYAVRLLPDSTVSANNFALPINSVATLRREPSVTVEMVTQTLRGLPLEVLKQERGFLLVRTDDGYLGWVSDDRVVWGGDSLRQVWETSPKAVYTQVEGVAYAKKSRKSVPVFDVVLGNRLKRIKAGWRWTLVESPDGKRAYLRSRDVIDFDEYQQRSPEAGSILETAVQLRGRPYLWGAASPKFMDCSGFTQTVFRHNGMLLQRDASMQVHQGTAVDTTGFPARLQPGDLVFFSPVPHRITHVGIYIGDSQFIHCAGEVKINSFDPRDKNYNNYRHRSIRQVRRVIPGK